MYANFKEAFEQFNNFIIYYYKERDLVWPDFSDALKFVITELGEAYEVDLSRKAWNRNNPESKPQFDKELLSKELGDVIFMVMVAGIIEGVNPLVSLAQKMKEKLGLPTLEYYDE